MWMFVIANLQPVRYDDRRSGVRLRVSIMGLTFLFPAILGAGAAAVAPVIIHLIMRTKPRRVVFPPLQFVRKTHKAQISKLRLKHLILLAMRVAAILLIALLVARSRIPGWRTVADRSAPAAAVFVMDNSGSMSYRHRGASLLSTGKRLARQVIDSLPGGSRAAVVATASPGAPTAFHGDMKLAAERLAGIEQGFGDETVAAGLSRALTLLADARLARKEVYVASDLAAHAWRDAGTALGGSLPEDVYLIVLRCGDKAGANAALGEVRMASGNVPADTEVALETTLASTGIGGEFTVQAALGGKAVDRQTVRLSPGGAVPVTLKVRPQSAGVRHGRIVLSQDDPLEMDNVRYFTLQVGAPAQVLVVRDATTVGRGDETSFLMANAIAPAGARAGDGAWVRRRTITADHLATEELRDVRIVLLANVSALSAAQWQQLESFVRRGGHVWVVAGELVSAAGYNGPAAQRIMPAAIRSLEKLPAPTGWKAPGAQGVLEPFANQPNPPLSAVLCKRRLAISATASDAHAILDYADGVPAIISRRVGDGSVMLWNFSPARPFSNLAALAQFPILAQSTVRLLSGGAKTDLLHVLGRSVSLAMPQSMAGAVATVRPPGEAQPDTAVLGKRRRTLSITANVPGHWNVEFVSGDERERRGFSVNTAPSESNLSGADEQRLAEAVGKDNLLIVSDLAELDRHRKRVAQPLDLTAPLLLAALALLIGESYFANRFYRTDTVPENPA